ncbi:hypothetical protein E6P78_30750 [Streptomyces sp. A0958]|uniref:hypothetical protein n=1 Tax=Streptomyces sp. A0958 TaxID=2563101 RepID=UPI00109EBF11|nr:hypothetical protein [Streptomyces sp. A0958]THA58094.1 hypothetical protein E6P78_30750 [Streptomyces sp. A0958]
MPPKPGVIPLGPLSLGDIFGGAFSTLGRYGKQLLAVGAALYGGALVVVGAAAAIAYSAVADHLDRLFALTSDEDPASRDLTPVFLALGAIALLGFLSMVVATAVVYAAVPVVLQEAVLGRPTTFSAVWRRAWSRVPAVIGAVLLTGLAAMVPMLLAMGALAACIIGAVAMDGGGGSALLIVVGVLFFLACVPVATWLWVKYSLAPSAAVFENQGPVASMRRSATLIRGDWWRVFGMTMLAGIIAGVASYLIQIPFSFLGMFTGVLGSANLSDDPNPAAVLAAMSGYLVLMLLGQLVSQLVVAVFPPLVTGLLYVDRRIRTENLAPVLAEAAAVPPQYTA